MSARKKLNRDEIVEAMVEIINAAAELSDAANKHSTAAMVAAAESRRVLMRVVDSVDKDRAYDPEECLADLDGIRLAFKRANATERILNESKTRMRAAFVTVTDGDAK